MNAIKIVVLGLLVVSITACNTSKEVEPVEKMIAAAGDEKLSQSEYNDLYFTVDAVNDSQYFAKKTIEKWATERLFYEEALSKLEGDELQVEKQVEAYRRDLVNYIYQSKLIEANLDTLISNEEIEEYYNQHRDNFILKENIVKVDYIKIPVKAPVLEKIKRLIITNLPKDQDQLKTLCIENAESFFVNDSTWIYLEEIKKEIPGIREQPDFNLSKGRVLQFSDETYYYYLKIKDVKIKNGLSPLNFEQQNIKKFILNNRKTILVNQYKLQMLEKAKAAKTFTVY